MASNSKNFVVKNGITIGEVSNATGDFATVSSGGVLQKRTPAEVLSDIGAASSSHNHTLDSLSNVTITSNSNGEILRWNGSAWVNNTLGEAGISATGHTHTTSDITNLSSYTGLDGRYYTESETDTLLSGKANTSHTHTTTDITNLSSYTGLDSRYYTETETDTLLSGKANTSHTHAAGDITSGTLAVARGGTGIASYTTGNYIYASGTTTLAQRTPAQVLSDIGAASSSHNHTLDSLSNVTITSNSNGEVLRWSGTAWVNNTLAEAGIAAASHTHTTSDITNLSSYTGLDSRYYTESEVDGFAVKLTGNQTIAGNKTFSDSVEVGTQLLTYPSSTSTVVVGSVTSAWHTTLPLSSLIWHDMFRWSTPTYETSTDGSSWSSGTLNKNLFSGKENQVITVCTTTQTFARWTWNTGMQYNYANWLVLGHTYVSPAPTVAVTVEVSLDGSSWTTFHSSSGVRGASPYFYKFGGNQVGNHVYVRVTIENVSATSDVRLSSMRLLTSRWGDQGQGKEREYPYNWDADRNLFTYGTFRVETLDNLSGDFVTASPTGVLQKRTAAQTLSDIGAAASSHTHTTSNITDLSSYTGLDARYYTESEVDSFTVKLTGNQTVAGIKTFSNTVYFQGTGGAIDKVGLSQDGFTGWLRVPSLTASRTYAFPDAGGEVALTSTVVTLDGTQSVSGAKTFSSPVALENNTDIRGKETGGTAKPMLYMNSANEVDVGNATNSTRILSDTSPVYYNGTTTYEIYHEGNLPASSGATGAGGDEVFFENDAVVTTSYTITTGKNALSAGPVTINDGVTVTIPDGSVWTII